MGCARGETRSRLTSKVSAMSRRLTSRVWRAPGRVTLGDQAKQILALCAEHGREAVNEALARADHFGQYSYAAVKSILQKQAPGPRDSAGGPARTD
jgi:hypothetical protein